MTLLIYIVKSGDWLAKIAEDHGTTVGAIWNHPGNAAHRAKRGSPDVLYPGDALHIDAAQHVASLAPVPPSPVEAAGSSPGSQEPAPWPYSQYEGPFSTKPTWECPGGTCECHPVPDDAPKDEHVIVFYDKHGVRMPGARCRVYEQGLLLTPDPTSADGDGELRVELKSTTSTLRVEWAPPNLPLHQFLPYRNTYHVKMSDDGDLALDRRLANLGFFNGRRRRDNVADYQRAYTRPPTGNPDDIRLEVLERHDNGTVEPFHPQAPGGPTEQTRSLFAAPKPRSGSALRLARDEQLGAGGGGQATPSAQNAKGSVVPAVADVVVLVMLSPDFGLIDPKKTTVQLRPRSVPGMDQKESETNIEPTVIPSGPSAPLSYEFKDIRVGIYDAIVGIEGVKRPGGRTTYALGKKELEVRQSWPSPGLLVTAVVGEPILSVSDPRLALDMEPMRRRRKVLATVFSTFPQWAGGADAARLANHAPPYDQGAYKDMIADASQNTCSAINAITNNIASAKKNKIDPAKPEQGPVPDGNGGHFGYKMKLHPAYVTYAEGLRPSVGDSVCFREDDGLIHHCGLFLGLVKVQDPSWIKAHWDAQPLPSPQKVWISADGGQRTPTQPFQDDPEWAGPDVSTISRTKRQPSSFHASSPHRTVELRFRTATPFRRP